MAVRIIVSTLLPVKLLLYLMLVDIYVVAETKPNIV